MIQNLFRYIFSIYQSEDNIAFDKIGNQSLKTKCVLHLIIVFNKKYNMGNRMQHD